MAKIRVIVTQDDTVAFDNIAVCGQDGGTLPLALGRVCNVHAAYGGEALYISPGRPLGHTPFPALG